MSTQRKLRGALAAVVVGAIALTSCADGGDSYDGGADGGAGSEDDGAAGNGGSGGQLVVAQSSDILTMDPHMHRNRPTQNVIHTAFESLVNMDNELNPVPELASEWEEVDEVTWRFHLREGVTFHNGDEFTAEDVKFSIERILDPEQNSPRASMLAVIEDVEIEDDLTVLITTHDPAPTLLASLAVNEIVPADYLQEVGDEEFAANPVGTGPFVFDTWTPNETVVLNANPDYWGGAPALDSVVFRPIPEVSSRLAALQSGDVHIAADIPADLSGGLTGNTEAVSAAGTRIFFLALNTTQDPLRDEDVRVAINQAVDKQTIVEALYEGNARVLNQPAFPEMVGYHDDFSGYEFDLDAASSVLNAVDGTLEIDVREADRTLAEAVAGQLQSAGLNASVTILEDQAFNERVESGASAAYLASWGVAEGDADVIMARHFWSPIRAEAFYTGFADERVDELIVAARSTLDTVEREELYAEATELIMGAAPWVPLINPEEIYGVSLAVTGWEPSPIGRFNLVDTALSEN